MSGKSLTIRGVRGEYLARRDQAPGLPWVNAISQYFTSDQEIETYPFLGAAPAMRLRKGRIQPQGVSDNQLQIRNQQYEASIVIPGDWLRRDKTGQIDIRINETLEAESTHWASLLTALILAGESTLCYDGQYFFDTDHEEGDSGQQSNDIGASATSATAPTGGEMETAIMKAVEAIIGFKNDKGEPMNESAREFHIQVPTPFFKAAAAALRSEIIVDVVGGNDRSRSNTIKAVGEMAGMMFDISVNPRLTWTTKFLVTRKDGSTKPLITQEEWSNADIILDESSEHFRLNDEGIFGVVSSRAVGYGHWQRACLVTFS